MTHTISLSVGDGPSWEQEFEFRYGSHCSAAIAECPGALRFFTVTPDGVSILKAPIFPSNLL